MTHANSSMPRIVNVAESIPKLLAILRLSSFAVNFPNALPINTIDIKPVNTQ
jgi:hypothetical protein